MALQLAKATKLILGPNTIVELANPTRVRILQGEFEIVPTEGSAVEVLGPGREKLQIRKRQLLQVGKEKLVALAKDPVWLQGFKGTIATESLGSLIAKSA